MKFRFKEIIRTTEISPTELIKKIITELEITDYEITCRNPLYIEFRWNFWRYGSKFLLYKKVSGGEFRIVAESNSLSLSCYCLIFFETIGILISIGIGVTQDGSAFTLAFLCFILGTFKILSVQTAAKELIKNILTPGRPSYGVLK